MPNCIGGIEKMHEVARLPGTDAMDVRDDDAGANTTNGEEFQEKNPSPDGG
jgi:hypothetical protein